MAKKIGYVQQEKQKYLAIIDQLAMDEQHKQFLQSRWLDQTLWMEREARKANRWYYVLRLTAIVGGVIVPALVSLNVGEQAAVGVRWSVFVISLLVAISVGVEEFFQFGDRWRHYRQTVEALKNEGWRFFQLTGIYRRYQNHNQAYPRFAGLVEDLSRQEVQTYITQVVEEQKIADESEGN